MRGFFLFLLLTSCVSTNQNALTQAVIVTGDDPIKISAPEGFCVDQSMTSKTTEAITLFIIDCVSVKNSMGNDFFRRPVSAILTATVIGPISQELKDIKGIRKFLTSDQGSGFLSRSSKNSILKLHQIEEKDGVLLFLIEQRSSNIDFAQSNFFWRSFLISKNRIISLTASNFSNEDHFRKILKNLILKLSRNIVQANR